jgi:tetratricopeptide (TPR) repeat protein
MAEEIKTSIPAWMHKKLMRYANHLLGMILFDKGEFSESIPYLSLAVQSLYSPEDNFPRIQAFMIFTLAQAHYKAGNLLSAQGEMEKLAALHFGRIGDGDFYARSLYTLAIIFEQQGQEEKAIQYFQQFLQIWEDADPGTSEVSDAKARLATLTKSPT